MLTLFVFGVVVAMSYVTERRKKEWRSVFRFLLRKMETAG
jgi:hypothetical protein